MKRISRSVTGDISIIIILSLLGFVMVLPMVYTISTSLKPLDEMWYFPPRFFVINPSARNFRDLFTLMDQSWVPFTRYIFNTVFVSTVGTAGHVILSSLCAYALSKHDFPGRVLIFRMIVLSLMFSAAVTTIPNYLIVARLGWIDNYAAVIVPTFVSSLGLYLMKQFMETLVPDSLLESARIDGAGEWYNFWHIVMPLVKPAWLTLVVLQFNSLWNAGANNFIYAEELKSLNTAILQISAAGIARAGTSAAAGVLMMVVPITVFIITQSNIIQTMATSGMKE